MWDSEKIFSHGDLCDYELYAKYIDDEYNGLYVERAEHVRNMIERLQNELELLQTAYKTADERHLLNVSFISF